MSEMRCMGCMLTYEETTDGRCPYCGYAEGTPAKEAYHIKPGSLLNDRYVIGRSIGYGGFGVTYIAWDNKLERRVAIKEYMPSDYATRIPGNLTVTIYDGERHNEFMTGLQKFMEEAQRLSKFQNTPGIVRILDTFARNLTAYIVMEYLDGVTLKEYLKENGGKMPYDKALEVMLPVLAALNAVHQEGIIHRDISPDNIFLTKEGEVKLLDFGAARYASNGYSKSLSVILKPGYAPEEQYYSHGQQGPWSDVYAAAATLYRMITGVVPEESLERKEKDNLKPPSALGAKLPKNAEKAILNALNIKAENRTQSAAEFESQLLATTTVVRIAEKKERRFSTRTPLWLKLVLGGAGAVAAAGVALFAMGVLRFGSGGLTFDFDAIQGNSVNTPGVINLTETEGADAARQAGLTLQVVGAVQSTNVKQGVILEQSPAPGEQIKKGGEINIKVSTGPQYALVPQVEDTWWEESRLKVKEAGFEAKVQYEHSQTVPTGAVISVSRSAGEVYQQGEKLKVVVSSGPVDSLGADTVIMPDIKGMAYQNAKAALNSKGLRVVRRDDRYTGEAAEGIILSQSAVAGAQMHAGDIVYVQVGLGIEYAVVPNTQYLSWQEAAKLIKRNGLSYLLQTESSETAEKGIVVSQSIKSGKRIQPKSSCVVITVSRGTADNDPQAVVVELNDNEKVRLSWFGGIPLAASDSLKLNVYNYIGRYLFDYEASVALDSSYMTERPKGMMLSESTMHLGNEELWLDYKNTDAKYIMSAGQSTEISAQLNGLKFTDRSDTMYFWSEQSNNRIVAIYPTWIFLDKDNQYIGHVILKLEAIK